MTAVFPGAVVSFPRQTDGVSTIDAADVNQIYDEIEAIESVLLGSLPLPSAMVDLVGPYLALPELRAFWPMSAVDESGNVRDLSGQARTLSNIGSTPRAVYGNRVPYADLNGSNQRFSRADEAGLSITGALTIGGWFYINSLDANYKYLLDKGTGISNTDPFQLYNSPSSTALNARVGSGAASNVVSGVISAGAWFFTALRFTPSTELAVFVNAVKVVNTTSIIAALNDNADAFTVGATNTPAFYLPGRASSIFLCAAALSDALLADVYNRTRKAYGI